MLLLIPWQVTTVLTNISLSIYCIVLTRSQLMLPQMSLLACGWEFVAEVSHTSGIAGPLQLILPQLALLAVIGIQFFPDIDVRYRKYVRATIFFSVSIRCFASMKDRSIGAECLCCRSMSRSCCWFHFLALPLYIRVFKWVSVCAAAVAHCGT